MSRLSPLRPFFLLAPLGLLYLLIGGRLVQLHTAEVVLAETYSDRLDGETTLLADRGMIVDRNGYPVAYDRPSYRLEYGYRWDHRRYNPETWGDEAMTEEQIRAEIECVAEVCELDPDVLEADLRDRRLPLRAIKWGINPFHADRIRGVLRDFPGFGLVLKETRTRVYPLGRGGSHLFGLFGQFWKEEKVGTDENGDDILESVLQDATKGLEEAYHGDLKGTPGVKQSERVKRGINPATAMIEPRNGITVETTIDVAIQEAVAMELERAYSELNPDNASAIVINVKTGAVYGAHSMPDYLPTKPDEEVPGSGIGFDGKPTNMHFKLADPLEPGSTFKTFVVARAIDLGVIGPQQVFEDVGHLFIRGRTKPVGNARSVPGGPKTAQECIVHSSNVVATQIMQAIGLDAWRTFCEESLFWEPLEFQGQDLRFSSIPKDWKWEPRYATSNLMPSMSFGQEMLVNPIRYAGLLAAFANEGVPVQPYLIPGQRKKLERMFSPRAANYVKDAMAQMMDRQVNRNKILPDVGVPAAAKSGTSQNPADKTQNTVLFATFAPVDDPQVLVFAVVHNPRVDPAKFPHGPSGTRHAGPLATRVLSHSLRILGITDSVDPRSLDSAEPAGNVRPTSQPR